jgi:hypothetical protein
MTKVGETTKNQREGHVAIDGRTTTFASIIISIKFGKLTNICTKKQKMVEDGSKDSSRKKN